MIEPKKFWIGYRADIGGFSVSIHAPHTGTGPQVRTVGPTILPPIDPVDGHRLSLEEARDLGKLEESYSVHFFSRDDLLSLRKVIDEALLRA